jgi:predicted transcriptional regulator
MSSRIKITLPDEIAARLGELAAASGEPVSRVAGQMVRDGLAKLAAAARGSGTAPADELTITRAAWLEPYGGDREWRHDHRPVRTVSRRAERAQTGLVDR